MQQKKKKKTPKPPLTAEQLRKKEKQKQHLIWLLMLFSICLVMIGGFYLIFSADRRSPPKEPVYEGPMAVLSSYVNAVEKEPPPVHTVILTTVPQTQENTTTPPTTAATTVPPSTATTVPPSQAMELADGQTTIVHTGELLVDSSENNRFIQIVNSKYKIKKNLLTAVYSVPDTGQNYVMEWNGATDESGKLIRSAKTIRRCYLIGTDGTVTSVASVEPNERVNLSRTENSLSMNTLIKRIILPAIEDKLN